MVEPGGYVPRWSWSGELYQLPVQEEGDANAKYRLDLCHDCDEDPVTSTYIHIKQHKTQPPTVQITE